MRRTAAPRRQRGAALMLIAALLILGVAWGAVAALRRAPVTSYEREQITAEALQKAKQAMLAHVAQYAARTDHDFPGRMTCPESLNAIGTANEGESPGVCSNTVVVVGRLPWKTLGLEPLTDGDGERLWYVLSPNFHPVAFGGVALNFNTPAALPFDGGNVVALIIAPGRAVNTLADPGTPAAPCVKVQQTENRYASPLNPAKFFECGNAAGNYANVGQSAWTNDRAISITQAEWAAAIAGGVADRLQRQVAPALNEWRINNSWGTNFLPFASTFSDPATNDRCGDIPGNVTANGVREGLMPTIGAATTSCSGWASANVNSLLGILFPPTCTADASEMQCSFFGLVFLAGLFQAQVTATAPRVTASFRRPITAGDVVVTPVGTTVSGFSLSLSATSGQATVQFNLSRNLLALSLTNFTVRIPHLPDANLLADARVTWFLQNQWDRHTYYAVAPSATLNSPAIACGAPGDAGCIEVHGLPQPDTGLYWNKRLVLALMGPALAGQDRAGAPNTLSNYLEEHNASTGDRIYRADLRVPMPAGAATPYPGFNDRLATCPFRYTKQDLTTTDICP